jgi:hypothetical protein
MTVMFQKSRYFIVVTIIAFQVFSGESPAIMIVASQAPVFEQVIEGLHNELAKSFTLTQFTFDSGFTIPYFNTKIAAVRPQAIILMGNKPIRFYKEYVDSFGNKKNDIPVVTLMASQMELAIDGLANVQGIAYETPMVTALVNFRSLIGQPINKVGVLYRGIFERFVKQHTEYCKKEKIEVKSILIGNETKSHKQEIGNALQQLIRKDKVEVVWIPNDNILLKPEILGEIWIPTFIKCKIPVIVGVESLVKPELNFGVYAVIPDPKALGEQAAGIIFDLENSGWQFDRTLVYPPLSVYSVLNMKKAESLPNASKININEVTKILKEGK